MANISISRNRRAGILLHPTSLPGFLTHGDIGLEARRFLDFMHQYGFTTWQVLPLGPTLDDGSPYQCLSAHAANPQLINLQWLEARGWLDCSQVSLSLTDPDYRNHCLRLAGDYFYQHCEDPQYWDKLTIFSKNNEYWVHEYALFSALKKHFQGQPWYEWPVPFRDRYEDEIRQAEQDLALDIRQVVFEQFVFFTQWQEIRQYAHELGIELFGDIPVFMGKDSADVWAQRSNFLVEDNGYQPFVAGVPPDAFSQTGQRWGNPLYHWENMQADNFTWWKQRFKTQLQLFDLIRIDHFRGLQACWYIPGDEETAVNGYWQEVPGQQMLQALFEEFSQLPVIAEDLGVITKEVIALKNQFHLPGMKVLQFAFDGNPDNPHLPHHHHHNDLIYTGTHDNDTTYGWSIANQYHYDFLRAYTGLIEPNEETIAFGLMRLALASVSFLAILPMQDLLMLDGSARMNTPGTTDGNWQWKFEWRQVNQQRMEHVAHLLSVFQRHKSS